MEREFATSFYKLHTRDEVMAQAITLSNMVEYHLRPDNEKADIGIARVYAKLLSELVKNLQQDLTPRQQ